MTGLIVNLRFHTNPLIVHAHGPLHRNRLWAPIRDRFFSRPARDIGPIRDLTVLTWNNGHAAMGLFERSMAHLGIPCLVTGRDVADGTWVNSIHKPLLTWEALARIDTPYVLGVDSRDAILLDDPRALTERFESLFSCGLVFSADRLNWPNLPEFRKFEDAVAAPRATDFRYLNSGAFIGRTAFCREFFEEAVRTPAVPEAPRADQGIFKKLFPKYYPRVQLDYQCELFQNIGFVLDSTIGICE